MNETVTNCLKCDKQIEICYDNDNILCDNSCVDCGLCLEDAKVDWFNGYVICELCEHNIKIKDGVVMNCPLKKENKKKS